VLPSCAAKAADGVAEIRVVTQLSEAEADDPGPNQVVAMPEQHPEPNRIADIGDGILNMLELSPRARGLGGKMESVGSKQDQKAAGQSVCHGDPSVN
jgi:hypothetical protein